MRKGFAILNDVMKEVPDMNNCFLLFSRYMPLVIVLAFCSLGCNMAAEADSSSTGIRVNQVGYKPDAVKTAVFVDIGTDGDRFKVINNDSGEVAFEGALSVAIDNSWSGETNRVADFSNLTQTGNFHVVSMDGQKSPTFAIGDDVYEELLRSTTRMLYLQRCGTETNSAMAGVWAHPACHTALATIYGTNEQIDVSGGWHDAGDYGRYVVSGAKAVADLMLAHEVRGDMIDDVGIPESGNGMDDLLEEAKIELDWMLKMQAPSGGVYHKVTCASFPAFIAPDREKTALIVCPISNTATGDFAAVMAMASRIYSDDWPEDAEVYLEAARHAWDYLVIHQEEPGFHNPADIVTGEYPDDNDSDERFWAAAELARATGEVGYREAASTLLTTGGKCHGMGWLNVGTYGLLAVLNDASLSESDLLRSNARSEMDTIVQAAQDVIELNPYGADRTDTYEWGSNMGIANTAALLMIEGKQGNKACRAVAQQPLDYLLGKNATGYCFVTAAGEKSPVHPHHRPSIAARQVMPGMLVGGPDSALEDPCSAAMLRGEAPAKCYVDNEQSYSTNEVCIYWNSPLVLMLSGM